MSQADWNPCKFAVERMGLTPYDWQLEAMSAVKMQPITGKPTSLAAANGSGKTDIVAASTVLSFLDHFGDAGGKAVLTSSSWTQVETQLIPAIRKRQYVLPNWRFLATQIKRSDRGDPQAIFFSTKDPGKAEGHHGNETAPLLVICDESKSIHDDIFTALDRCTIQYLLLISSTGPCKGEFYRSHTKNKHLYYTIKVTYKDCPHIEKISPGQYDRHVEKYGINHPWIRSKYYSEFMEGGEQNVVSATELRELQYRPPAYVRGATVVGLDFAAGGDENVIAIREGNRVYIKKAWRDPDTARATRKFHALLQEDRIGSGMAFGDAPGLGVVMINAINDIDQGFQVNKFWGGNPASNSEAYANMIAEAWEHFGNLVRRKLIIPQFDEKTFEQLTTRLRDFETSEKKRIRLQPKEELSSSPDRADAVVIACYCGPPVPGYYIDTPRPAVTIPARTSFRPTYERVKL